MTMPVGAASGISVVSCARPGSDAEQDGLTGIPLEVFCEIVDAKSGVRLPVYQATYDDFGRLQEKLVYDSNGKFVGRVESVRDTNGLRTGTRIIQGARLIVASSTLMYDDDAHVFTESVYDSRNQLVMEITITYSADSTDILSVSRWSSEDQLTSVAVALDERGNVVEDDVRDTSGTTIRRRVYVHEFDGYGNWIRRETYEGPVDVPSSQLPLINVMYRTIQYRGWT